MEGTVTFEEVMRHLATKTNLRKTQPATHIRRFDGGGVIMGYLYI